MHRKIKAILLLSLFGGTLLFWSTKTYAATGTIYITPNNNTVQVDSSFNLALRIDPGTYVDTIYTTINFDVSKLEKLSIDISSSAFPNITQNNSAEGTITLQLNNSTGGVNSDSLIANLTFRALSSSGSTSVSLSGVNASYSGSYTSPSSADGIVNFTVVPAASSGSGSSSGGSTTTKKKTTSAAPTKTETPPVAAAKPIVTLGTSKPQYSKASVSLATNLSSQVALKYGLSQNKLDKLTSFIDTEADKAVSLEVSELTPGTEYFYQVVVKDAAGDTPISEIKSFKTKGYSLKLTILDKQKKPLAGKMVTIHSTPITAKTDTQGVVTFEGLAPGQHEVAYNPSKSETYRQSVSVANKLSLKNGVETANTQNKTVVLSELSQSNNGLLKIILTILVILIIFAGLCLLIVVTPLWSKIFGKLKWFNHNTPNMTQPPTVILSS